LQKKDKRSRQQIVSGKLLGRIVGSKKSNMISLIDESLKKERQISQPPAQEFLSNREIKIFGLNTHTTTFEKISISNSAELSHYP